jgi:hypothetical protein
MIANTTALTHSSSPTTLSINGLELLVRRNA